MAEQTSAPVQVSGSSSGSNPVVTFFLLLMVLVIAGGISYLGYKIFKGDIKMPGLSPKMDNASEVTAATGAVARSNAPAEPASSGGGSPASSSSVAAETVSGKKWFPLKRVYGADLHTANPFVKDLQQFLNKNKGTHLDIDGAFGADTEKEVMKAFGGEKEISMNDYNIAIAPYLGKPQVA
jgi:hypothetical protein